MDLATGGFSAALVLGLLLGLRHATDADHVVAVSMIVSDGRGVLRGLWIGLSWGLGHSTPLLALGIAMLLAREALLAPYEAAAPVLEFGVGVMLVLLGAQVFWRLRRRRLHMHEHLEAPRSHVHVHQHHRTVETVTGTEGPHGPAGHIHAGPRSFSLRSYLVGMVHGLAGSAAVMLLLLPQAPTFFSGFAYLLLFGVGTVLSMAGLTLVLSVPVAVSTRARAARDWVAGAAGAGSLLIGAGLMSDISLGTHLLGFMPQ